MPLSSSSFPLRSRLTATLLALGLGLAPMVLSPGAVAQTPQASAVFYGADGANTRPVTFAGLSRSVRFTVTTKDGAVQDTSNADGVAFDYDGDNANTSIVDLDQMASSSSLSAVVTLTNTTASPLDVQAQYAIGRAAVPSARTPLLALAGEPVLSGSAAAALSLTSTGGTGTRLEGTLAPGESVTLTMPLTLTNKETLSTSEGAGWDTSYTWLREEALQVTPGGGTPQASTQSVSSYIRFAHRVLNASGTDFLTSGTQYLGTTLTKGVYTTVPADVQAYLPSMQAGDFVTEQIYRGQSYQDYVGPVTNFMDRGSNDSALYTGSLYYLSTTRIKASLEGSGWSVNNLQHPALGDQDQISDVYAYQTWGGLTIQVLGPDGTVTGPLEPDPSRQYVELYQYIKGHDLTLDVGEPYDPSDTLDWIQPYYTGGEAGRPADLGLEDPRTAVDASAVDTSRPGVYPVTYRYTPVAGGESVTLTVHVTVRQPPVSPTATPAPSASPTATPAPPVSPTATPAPTTVSSGPGSVGPAAVAGSREPAGPGPTPSPVSSPVPGTRQTLARTGTSAMLILVPAVALCVAGAFLRLRRS